MKTWMTLRDADRGPAPAGTKQCRACWFVDDTRYHGDELEKLDGDNYFKEWAKTKEIRYSEDEEDETD